MKQSLALLLLLVVIFCCFSCGVYEKTGIYNYDKGNSNFSLSTELLPSDDFLEKFSYVEGNYYYVDRGGYSFTFKDEQEIMYFVYEEDVYESVKNFTLENVLLSKENRYSYNGYEFIENICRLEGRDPNIVNSQYPYSFNMIGFNDKKHVIVFMGFYMPKNLVTPEIEQLLTFEDMGAFLKEYFSFYDFDA